MKNFVKNAIKVLCSAALATMCLPACTSVAMATPVASGGTFTVGNFQYTVTVSSARTVQLSATIDPSAEGEIITVPKTVEYDGETYSIVGIKTGAFTSVDGKEYCTNVKDIRIPDLGTGQIYPEAFGNCTNLQVVNFMGRFSFIEPTHYYDDFGSLASVKFIIHSNSDWCFDETGGVTFPSQTQTYYGVDFEQDGETQTVYVEGPSSVDGTVSGGTKVSDLLTPSSVNVYCDAGSSDPVCPVSSVPSLTGQNDAWKVTSVNYETISNYGSTTKVLSTPKQLAVSDVICASSTAVAINAKNLEGATATVVDALSYTGSAQTPELTVLNAKGEALTEGVDYAVSYAGSNGDSIDAAEIINSGTYKAIITGIGSCTGSCSVEFTIAASEATWNRACGEDRYATLSAVSSQASVLAKSTGSGEVSSWARIVANADDWSSLVIADSLAGLYSCTVVAVSGQLESGALPLSAKLQMNAVRNGNALVVGDESNLSSEYVSAVSSCVNGSTSRVTAKATDAADKAVAAYNFVRNVENGAYSLSLPDDYESYGSTAVVVSESEDSSAIFTALAWANAKKAPVFFCSYDGSLSSDTVDALMSKDAQGNAYFNNIVALGSAASKVDAIESQVSGMKVQGWSANDDELSSSVSYAEKAIAEGTCNYSVLCLAEYDDTACLACSAAVAGLQKGTLYTTDFIREKDASMSMVEAVRTKISYCTAMGGFASIPQSCYEELQNFWDRQDSTNASINLRLCTIELSANKFVSNGMVQTPNVTVTNPQGVTLTEGTDYTLVYYNNATSKVVSADSLASVGSYTVSATGTYKSISGGFDHETRIEGTYRYTRSAAFTVTAGAAKITAAKSPAAGSLRVTATAAGTSKVRLAYKADGASAWSYTDAVAGSAVVLSNLKAGCAYQVKAAGLNADNTMGAWSAAKTARVLCAKPTIKSAKAKGHRVLAVTWAKVTGAASYQVRYRVGKGAWKTKTFKKVSVKLSKLKSGKKYKVQVRAKNAAGWSAWSKVKTSAKVK